MSQEPFIIDEVRGLYRVIALSPLRRTQGVWFDMVPPQALPRIDAIDRVIHEQGAVSPGAVSDTERPWYMHQHQEDNLMVLHGTRHVDIYSASHGKVESFSVSPNLILKAGKVLYDGPAMLVWPVKVFHRIRSDASTGSASLNFAVRYEGFDIKTNFSIYDLDPATGAYRVIREGHLDQPQGGI